MKIPNFFFFFFFFFFVGGGGGVDSGGGSQGGGGMCAKNGSYCEKEKKVRGGQGRYELRSEACLGVGRGRGVGGSIGGWGGGGGGSKVWGRWVMWGMGDVNQE